MKIGMINGSPKMGNSCSALLLHQLQNDLSFRSTHEFKTYRIHQDPLSETDIDELIENDIIIVAFPLYVDGIPSHMLSALYQLENAFRHSASSQKPIFYGIINNGFLEGNQNEPATRMLTLFCKRAGLVCGQIFATGGGEMIRTMIEMNMPFGEASLSYLKQDWNAFVETIETRQSSDTVLLSPKMPSFLFRLIGNITFWDKEAKKNGISRKKLGTRLPYHPRA